MLPVRNLTASYGYNQVLHGIDLDVGQDEIVTLIGSNGAGKTTLLNSISGHVKITGEIQYQGVNIAGRSPHAIARMGLLQVPEGRHVFPGLSVEENLGVGTVADRGLRISRGDLSADLDRVYQIFPRLKERRSQLAWSLSGGEQQMLAIGRALMGHPKLLMLDEPSMGLAPLIIEEVFERIVEINRLGTPVLLVEQNATLALKVSQRAYILERGRIKFSGPSQEVANDERVREAYLGVTRR